MGQSELHTFTRRGVLLSLAAVAGAPRGVLPASKVRTFANLAYGPDPRQRLDLYLPNGRARAAVLFVHGGSWSHGRKGRASPAGRAFAAQGIAFASMDYRLYPQVAVPEMIADVTAAFAILRRELARRGYSGPVSLAGHSAGAHLAACAAARVEAHRLVLLDGGAYDASLAVRTDPERRAALGGPKDDLDSISPVVLVRTARRWPPTLVAHGLRPDRVEQARRLEAALKARGFRVRAETYRKRHTAFVGDLAVPANPLARDVVRFLTS